MALEKEIVLENRCKIKYIKISGFRGNKDSCLISVDLYSDEQARLDGCGYVEQREHRFNGVDNPLKADCINPWGDMYSALKTIYIGAVDC